jgi:hypothetical protein
LARRSVPFALRTRRHEQQHHASLVIPMQALALLQKGNELCAFVRWPTKLCPNDAMYLILIGRGEASVTEMSVALRP